MLVKKRDLSLVPFSEERIVNALVKAGTEWKVAEGIAGRIRAHFELCKFEVVSIDQIQEWVLKHLNYEDLNEVHDRYLNYMLDRNSIRKSGALIVEELGKILDESHGSMKENANINALAPMGKMLKLGSAASKKMYLHTMPKAFSKSHESGAIHVHDLEFHDLTLTCCQIPVGRLLSNGFGTGHGNIREPQRIGSYASLACIIIQSNQNDMHGGQSIPTFDYDLAPGVLKSYRKNFRDILYNAICVLEDAEGVSSVSALDPNKLIDFDQLGMEELSYGDAVFADLKRLIPWQLIKHMDRLVKASHNQALKKTEDETFQAMEALVHNLNTMHCRAGSQVPFSSINYGTDISLPGRMVTKNILLALEKGMGNGETPIFPIHIFKVKSGVNYEEGTPNHDLWKLACRVTSKRLFPNFSFLDAPFNSKYYVEGRPETEVAYMGCVEGDELITVKVRGKLRVDSFERIYHELSNEFVESRYGESLYLDVELKGVEIYDSHCGDFTPVKKFIKNPDHGDWTKLSLSDGRQLLATSDHPLPVKDRGRVLVKDLCIGDEVTVVYSQYTEETENLSVDQAWLLGLIMCNGYSDNSILISLGLGESGVKDKLKQVVLGIGGIQSEVGEGFEENVNWIDLAVKCGSDYSHFKIDLKDLFGGKEGWKHGVPQFLYQCGKEERLAFLAGMIDADDCSTHHSAEDRGICRVQLVTKSKRLSLQKMALVQSLGIPVKVYENMGIDGIRYLLEFPCTRSVLEYMASYKKRSVFVDSCCGKGEASSFVDYARVIGLVHSDYVGHSYDVETESDHFDVSGINSHNCRTRLIGNVHDKDREIVVGRGNLNYTSINLPRLAIESGGDLTRFLESLHDTMVLVGEQLFYRRDVVGRLKKKNFPFLMGQGLWMDSEKLDSEDTIAEVIKHGSLSIGFIGLAETLKMLTGKHHGECPEAQKLGLEIVGTMRRFCTEMSNNHHINFTLIATPAEGLSGRFVDIDRVKYGEISGVTDREYYTNSFHVPVYYDIDIVSKIKLEAPYHELCDAGHISYIELDGAVNTNPEAVEDVIKIMYESGIGYGAINHPVDFCVVCGYSGVIGDICPKCGRDESEIPFQRIRRITGYLVGSLSRFNNSKLAEVRDRVKHFRRESVE